MDRKRRKIKWKPITLDDYGSYYPDSYTITKMFSSDGTVIRSEAKSIDSKRLSNNIEPLEMESIKSENELLKKQLSNNIIEIEKIKSENELLRNQLSTISDYSIDILNKFDTIKRIMEKGRLPLEKCRKIDKILEE